jgi:hypothetical protein
MEMGSCRIIFAWVMLSAEFYDAYLWDLARMREPTLYWFLPVEKQHSDHCNHPVVVVKVSFRHSCESQLWCYYSWNSCTLASAVWWKQTLGIQHVVTSQGLLCGDQRGTRNITSKHTSPHKLDECWHRSINFVFCLFFFTQMNHRSINFGSNQITAC